VAAGIHFNSDDDRMTQWRGLVEAASSVVRRLGPWATPSHRSFGPWKIVVDLDFAEQ